MDMGDNRIMECMPTCPIYNEWYLRFPAGHAAVARGAIEAKHFGQCTDFTDKGRDLRNIA